MAVLLKMLSACFMIFLHVSPVFSQGCPVQMDNQHLYSRAPSSVIRAVEFQDAGVLPLGSNVTISCISNLSKENFGRHKNAQPYWIQIYRNDEFFPVQSCGGGDRDNEDSKVCTFFIQNATREDSGVYECWSYNQMTCTRDSINLDFREPSPPRFTVNPPLFTYISAGRNFNISCEASGVPRPVLTWYKDGLPVAGDKSAGVKGVSQLTIESVTSANQGMYWCEAKNVLGLKRSLGTSLILTQKPTILLYRQSVSVYLEGNYTVVSFLCKATGTPRPLIGWLKDNSTKTNGTVIQIGSISMLILVLVGKNNKEGKYRCVGKNSIGEDYSKEAEVEFLTQSKHTVTMGGGVSDRMSFSIHPRSTTTSPGDQVVFTCVAEGSPVPKITWLKDGMPNVNGNATSVEGQSSAFSVLTIYPVEGRHGGKYACQAISPMGNIISREAVLSITPASHLHHLQDDASNATSGSEFLWVSVAMAAVLLVVLVILIFVIHNKYRRRAGFDINNEINEEQQFSHLKIHKDAMIQRPSDKKASAAPHLQMTNMAVENEAYTQNVF